MSKFGQTSNFSAERKVPVDQPETCSKGHILLALLFVSVLSLALISGDLFLQIRRDPCPGCEQSVLPLPFAVGLLALSVPASLPSRELPQSCFPAGQQIRFAAPSLFPAQCRDAGKAGQQPHSHSSCAGCDPTVPTASPAPGPSFPAFLWDYFPAEVLAQSSDTCR